MENSILLHKSELKKLLIIMIRYNYLDLSEKLHSHMIEFVLYPIHWNKFRSTKKFNIKKAKWKETKYLNNNGNDLNVNVKNITNKSGGIYLFIIKSDIIPGISEYLVYIGRAQFTRSHNLRIRVRKYFKEYLHPNDRPKIIKMMKYWGNNLFLKYIELNDNTTIKILEARLINTLIPPFNDEMPDKKTRKAIKAFK